MDFWFEFIDIHMNEQTTTFHDFHGFKWKNINIFFILPFSTIQHLFLIVGCDYVTFFLHFYFFWERICEIYMYITFGFIF